jgi:hypothetical protein
VQTLVPASILSLIIGSKVSLLVSGTTWQIRLPFCSIIPNTGILSFQFLPWVLGAFLFQCLLRFEPPKKASSISTEFPSLVLKAGFSKINLKRCSINQAVFWVTLICLANWQEEILWEAKKERAKNHFFKGRFEFRNIVRLLAVKYLPVFLHLYLLPVHL